MRTQTSVALLHYDRAAAHLSKPLQIEISSTITVQERSGRTSVFTLIDSQNMWIKPANSQNKPSLKRRFLFTATAEELESLKEPLFQSVKLLSFFFLAGIRHKQLTNSTPDIKGSGENWQASPQTTTKHDEMQNIGYICFCSSTTCQQQWGLIMRRSSCEMVWRKCAQIGSTSDKAIM